MDEAYGSDEAHSPLIQDFQILVPPPLGFRQTEAVLQSMWILGCGLTFVDEEKGRKEAIGDVVVANVMADLLGRT